jgi:hypothetical protein
MSSRYLTQRALCHPALPISRKESRQALQHVDLSDELKFYEHLGQSADTRVEPGIDQDEFFDDQFERRAHEIQRTPGANNAVNVIASKTGPWTGNNQLGIERAFAPDANNRQTILKLDEWGFPQLWTLALGLTYDAENYASSGLVTGSFGIIAEVEFGTGGVTQQVEVDWKMGTSICLPMNAVNVVASFSAVPTEGGDVALPPDLRLRANIVHGQLTQAAPTRTYNLQESSGSVLIPPFAKRFRIVPQLDPFTFYSQLLEIRLTGSSNIASNFVVTHTYSQMVTYLDATAQLVGPPAWIDIPEMARFVHTLGDTNALIQFEIGV